MEMKTLYAKREKETVGISKGLNKTVLRDENGQVVGIYPPNLKQPEKRLRTIMHNSFKYRLSWDEPPVERRVNPFASDAKNVRVKTLPIDKLELVTDQFPNFSKTGSISGMKAKFYGKGALLVKCGSYIYNVTSKPSIYDNEAY